MRPHPSTDFNAMIQPLLRHLSRVSFCLLTALLWCGSSLSSNAAATLGIMHEAPMFVASGTNVELSVRISVSVENVPAMVIWVKLPDHGSSSLVYPTAVHPAAPYPGQNDEPTFVSATSSGQFTASEIVVLGTTIPARSVYWTTAAVSKGSAFVLRTTMRAKVGTLQDTQFKTTAFAAASNAASVQSAESTITVSGTSTATLNHRLKAGIIPIAAQNYTQPGTDNTLEFQLTNPATLGNSTLYQTSIYEDLSALTPFIDDGGDGLDSSDFADITSGGTFLANFIPPLGGTARPAIVWSIPSLAPGDTAQGSFRFHFRNDATLPPDATQYTRTVIAESAQFSRQTGSDIVKFPLTETPIITTALGERIRGAASLSSGQDHPLLSLGNNETFQVLLQVTNGSAIRLDDCVVFFKIPTAAVFVSAMLPALANGSIFYATTTDPQFTSTNPPLIDPSRAPNDLDFEDGTIWQNLNNSPPANPQSVTWLAFHIPRLSSPFFPSGPPSSAEPEITLQAALQDPCTNQTIASTSLVRVYRKTLLNHQTVDAGPVEIGSETELTAVLSIKPTISGSPEFAPISPRANIEFEFNLPLSNSDATYSADLTASQLRLQWPAIMLNGAPTFLELVETSPATIIAGDPATGDVTIDFGALAKGANRTFTARFKAPASGMSNASNFQATATLTWADACLPNSFTASKTTILSENPYLTGVLEPIAAHTPPGGLIDCAATVSNLGPAFATGTFAIVPIPPKTVFTKAMHPTNGSPILFSNANYPAMSNFSYPVRSRTFVLANFTVGTPSDNGTPGDPTDDFWTSPFGETTTTVAFSMDDLALNLFPAPSGSRTIRWQFRNDEDPGPVQVNSPLETVIKANFGIFSNELLTAIANEQATIIRNTPSPEFLVFDGPNDNSPALTDGQLSSINFGTVFIGEACARTFTVKNTGTENLTFSSITFPSGFSEVGSPLAGTLIAPGATAQIEVALNVNAAANFSGSMRFYRFTGDTNPFDFPITGIVKALPAPNFEIVALATQITPASLNQFPGEIEFTMSVRNKDDAGLAPSSTASISWPYINVNGNYQAAELLSISPSTITSDFREFGSIAVDFGALSPGESKTLTTRFRIPRGTTPQSFTVSAAVTTSTPAGHSTASDSATADLVGSPAVLVTLPALPAKTRAGSDINFTVRFQESGDASLDVLAVLIPVPAHIVVDRAYGSASKNGIYFSDQPAPPLNATPITIRDYFYSSVSAGEPNDAGTPDDPSDDYWLSPFGETTKAIVYYIGETLTSPSGIAELRWKGRNDDDSGPASQPSPTGTVISSQAVLLTDSSSPVSFLSNSITTTIGRSPVWNGYRVTINQNVPATVALAKLLARASDPDGDTITLALSSATSSEGGTLEFDANGLTYTPPIDFTGADELDLILSDGDFPVPARITLQVIPAGNLGVASANLVSFKFIGGQAIGVFAGIPDRSYLVQRSTDLIHWDPLATIQADSTGIIRFTDTSPPLPNAFYRTSRLP